MKVKVTQSCLIVCDTMDCTLTMRGIWETLGVAWPLKAEVGIFPLEAGGWTAILHLN